MKTLKLKTAQTNYSKFVLNQSRLVLLFIAISIFSLTSCKSDDNEKEDEKPDGIALNNRFNENRQDAIQLFNKDICSGCVTMVTGNQGTTVIFPPNSLGLNGTPITGNIQIELIEIYKKADMVLQDVSSKGKKPNGDEEALNSAGEFFVNAKQNGTQLEILTPITIESKRIEPQDWEPMGVFKAGDNIDDKDIWKEADENGDQEPDQAEGREGEGTNGTYTMYSVFDTSSFGWTNLDRWYNYTGQLTDLFVDVPTGFDGDNCAVYLSYDGETGLARMDIYNATQELFTEHYGRIPVGKEVHFIMIAEVGGVLQYAIQPATIVDGHIEVITALQPTTETQLTALINALP
jgi:hypothetical protein